MPYVAYGIYFGLAFLCDADAPESCWPFRLLFFFFPIIGLAWAAAVILLLYSCSRAQPDRFPLAPAGAFLASNLVWWPLAYGQGEFFRALPVALRHGAPWTSIPSPPLSGDEGIAYAIFFVGLPLTVAVAGLGLFLWRSTRNYAQKVTAFTLFVGAFTLILVLNLSKLVPLPYYLWSLFWLLPAGACFVYLRTGARPPGND